MMTRSKNKIKMNSFNEVSKFIAPSYFQVTSDVKKEINYNMLHFFIMYIGAARLLYNGKLIDKIKLPEEYTKIEDKNWDRRHAVLNYIDSEYISPAVKLDAEYMYDKKVIKYILKRTCLDVYNIYKRGIKYLRRSINVSQR